MKKYIFIVIFSWLFSVPVLNAAPNGAELLNACRNSLENGFSDLDGMMCTWYVTPCDCDLAIYNHLPRVCLPQTPDINALAREVIEGLLAQPELQQKDAAQAAAMILVTHYPCAE